MQVGALDTFPKLLRRNAETRGQATAIREKSRGIWRSIGWKALADESAAIAGALSARGLKRGDVVAVIGDNRPRLFVGIAAAQMLGAVAAPLFQDASVAELAPQLRAAGATHAFAENQEQVDKLLEALPLCPALRCIVYDDDRSMRHYRQPQLVHYDALLEEGEAFLRREPRFVDGEIARGSGADSAFLFFTSGAQTTPKGVLHGHRGLIDRAEALARREGFDAGDSTMAYLPAGWLCQTLFAYMLPLATGMTTCCPESSDTLLADLREIAPTVFLATPRILDAIESQVTLRLESAGGMNLSLHRRAMALAERRQAGGGGAFGDRIASTLYDALVYGPLRDTLGMSRVKAAFTAGDAVDPSALAFFRALGVNLKQLYGATETAFVVTAHRNGAVRPDTVGEPLEGVEIAFSPEQEVLVRSPGLFSAYLTDAAPARDAGGWFRTGDIGHLEPDGQLVILDRASDVGALEGGAPYAPRQIENRLKYSPYVREAVAIGNGRPWVTALIDIDTAAIGRWADEHGIPYTGHGDLASLDPVYDFVGGILAGVNAEMARDPALAPLTIRRFALLPKELSAGDGVLTRTGKLRRGAVAERFRPLVDGLYSGATEAPSVDVPAETHGGAATIGVVKIRDVPGTATQARRAA